MSLAILAQKIHYSRGHLSKVENGQVRPTPELAQLCDEALGANGALVLAAASEPPARQRRAVNGHFSGLPHDTVHFTGRTDELLDLRATLTNVSMSQQPGAPVICVLHGMPGVGKTALALHVAHELVGSLRHGCLFIDLHGYTPGVRQVPPGDALDRLLRQLGVPGEEIPTNIEDRSALYRDRLRTKDILIILDNVDSVDHVLPLLPAAPGCRVLVTSRVRLSGLDDARHIHVKTLTVSAATDLFRTVVAAQRPVHGTDAERHLAAIVDYCDRLPLAIRIAAARYRDNPAWTVLDLERRLADREARLDELNDGTRSVAAMLASSYQELPTRHRHLAACLGLHPGADLDANAAAALAGIGVAEARQILDRLVWSHLLEERHAGRYTCHDLLRSCAARIAVAEIDEAARAAAQRRVVDYYLVSANAADMLLTPHRHRLPLDIVATPEATPAFSTYTEAFTWMSREYPNLISLCRLAAQRRFDRSCWQLAYTLRGYFFLTKQWDAWVATHEFALSAAQRCADAAAQAHTLNNLGLAYLERGQVDDARDAYERALALFREQGDDYGASASLGNLAWVYYYQGDYATALAANESAYAFNASHGNRRNAAIALRGVALTMLRLGRARESIEHLHTALSDFTTLGLDLDAAMAWNCLGEAYLEAGEPTSARRCYRQAMTLSRRCGSRFEQARAHDGLGACAAATGDEASQRRHRQQALAGYATLNATAPPHSVDHDLRVMIDGV